MNYLIGMILFLIAFLINIPFEFSAVFFITYVLVLMINTFFLNKAGISDSKTLNALRLVLAFIMLGIVFDYHTACVANGSDEFPWLVKGDYSSYHDLGMFLAKEGLSTDVLNRSSSGTIQIGQQGINYIGFPFVVGFIYTFFYQGFITLVLYNFLISSLIIVTVGIAAYNIFKNIVICRQAMVFSGIIPVLSFLYMFPLKDPTIILGFSLCLLVITNWKLSGRNILLILLAAIIFFSMRTFLFLILPAFYYVLFGLSRKLIAITVMSFLLVFFIQSYASLVGNSISVDSFISSLQGGTAYDQWSYSENKSTVQAVLGNFNTWSPIKRFFALPLLILVQYLMPINFWSFENNDYFYEYIAVNYNLIWLIYFGPLLIFGYMYIKRTESAFLYRLSMIGLLFYALVAFSFGGVIPRYAAPFFPIFCIIMAKARFDIKQNHYGFGLLWSTFTKYYFSVLLIGAAILFIYKMVL